MDNALQKKLAQDIAELVRQEVYIALPKLFAKLDKMPDDAQVVICLQEIEQDLGKVFSNITEENIAAYVLHSYTKQKEIYNSNPTPDGKE